MQNVSNPSELTLTFDKFFTESALISKHVISDLLSSGHYSTLKDSELSRCYVDQQIGPTLSS